ncbi:translation initiation factor IF-2-like [Trachypithecus francoisi]|uniref:translation initiation factor IF-2-like n=1 Tax=Trachypithecus francoisi TaxID=54180 RepID=UPI00141AB2CE|nr:translation initiation factor IF-2-like [Trachypithecus francoisi]
MTKITNIHTSEQFSQQRCHAFFEEPDNESSSFLFKARVRALRGGIERGVGGPHAPHPQPRPGGGERAGRLESPSQSAPGRRNLPLAPGPGVQGPLSGQGPGRRGPQRRGRGLSGEEAVNSPSVRASPRRAPLSRPRRGPPRPPTRPGAAAPGVRDTGRESGPLPGELRELAERPQEQRRGKSALTCHYFLRRLGSTCQRPHKALWTPHVCIESARGFLAAGDAELLPDLFVRVDVSLSAPAAALPGSQRAAGVAFRARQTSSSPAARRGASALGKPPRGRRAPGTGRTPCPRVHQRRSTI